MTHSPFSVQFIEKILNRCKYILLKAKNVNERRLRYLPVQEKVQKYDDTLEIENYCSAPDLSIRFGFYFCSRLCPPRFLQSKFHEFCYFDASQSEFNGFVHNFNHC